MIYLTKLDGGVMALNAEHIERIEAHPDTVVYLTYGTHLVVRESLAAVVEAVLESRAEVLRRAGRPTEGRGGPATLRALPESGGRHAP